MLQPLQQLRQGMQYIHLLWQNVPFLQPSRHALPELIFHRLCLFHASIWLVQIYHHIPALKIIKERAGASCSGFRKIGDIALQVYHSVICLKALSEIFHILAEPRRLLLPTLLFELCSALLHIQADLTKPPQRLILRHKYLHSRIDLNLFQLLHRALALHIYAADRIHLISPEVDAAGALLRQRKKVQDASPDGELSLPLHLRHIFIAQLCQSPLHLCEIQSIPLPDAKLILYIFSKGQAEVHPGIYRRHDCYRLLPRDGLDHLQPLLHNGLSMDIGTVKDQILRRIIHNIPVIHAVILHNLFGADLIVCNDQTDIPQLLQSIDKMTLLGVNTADDVHRGNSLFHGYLQLVVLIQFPQRA